MQIPAIETRRIKVLPALVASQIAAGEVVERPASVVKELVENSLDAGATKVVVELEQGGVELIRVTDDGCGIHAGDLTLAVSAHATSKIALASDLDHIATLGFRGEALASVASVSKLTIRSRTVEETGATQLDCEGDVIAPAKPASGPVGTSVTVRTLFFNTPARRKFLRTVPTEQGRCVEILKELSLGRPAVGFTVICDGRTVFEVPREQGPRERALEVLGKELATQVLEVHADSFDDARGLALWGLVGLPAIARATNKSQHILLNGRAIRDRTIQHAIGEAYRGLIEPARYPTAVLLIEMSPEGVDVNVHPAKAEVRFRDSSSVHQAVLNSVRRALRAADLTPSIGLMQPGRFGGMTPGVSGSAILPESEVLPMTSTPARVEQSFAAFFERSRASQQRMNYGAMSEALRTASHGEANEPALTPLPAADRSGALSGLPVTVQGNVEAPAHAITPLTKLLQVHKSYLVTQDEQGVVIIDQHALHERAMFEHLLARVTAGGLESQRLLTPVVVNLSPTQVAKLEDLQGLLGKLGIEARAVGPRSVAVDAFATFLFDRNVDPLEFMTDLMERAESQKFEPGSEQALRDVLDMMACKAAVKAGDQLNEDELGALAELRQAVERSSNCPHGRPTSIRLTIKELERLFGRS